jgi:UDP-glucose-4-epimerase GalE
VSVLIVGGAGYIGSHTAKLVAQAGLLPVVLDSLVSGHRWAVQWGPLVEGELEDRGFIGRVLAEHHVESVIHLAACASAGESLANPRKYFRNNVVCTLNLLDAMVDHGVRDIVFSSTCATYGSPETLPIPEAHIQRPNSPYGESKLAVERMLRWYQDAYPLRCAALRYFNAAGADPDGELGEDHTPETHLVPLAIEAVLGRRPAIEIFGTDYPTPDGTAVRDYVHVSDLAAAHVLALEHLARGATSMELNLGTGIGHSVRDVLSTVEKVSGRRVPAKDARRRDGDPPILIADPRHAARVLGWAPKLSDLETIVRHAYDWHKGRAASSNSGPMIASERPD